MNRIYAPFNEDQVDALNKFQSLGYIHPFTCPNNHGGERILEARESGWVCPDCNYTQNWAHDFMGEVDCHPVNPMSFFFDYDH